MDEVLNIDLSQLPEPLREILRVVQIKGALVAPEVFKKAMAWVWEQEKQYIPSYFLDEIQGMANGMCDSLSRIPGSKVSVSEVSRTA
jgi:ubiquinone/menaquinone biosynthesis C-methylase UbiE